MSLKFINPRAPSSTEELTEIERDQLAFAGQLYDGEDLTAAQRLSSAPEDEEVSFMGFLTIWDVVDEERGGELAYRAFLYRVDSGTFFVGDTLDVAAEVIQFYLDGDVDEDLHARLAEAIAREPEVRINT